MFEDHSSSYFKYDPFYWDTGGDTSRRGSPGWQEQPSMLEKESLWSRTMVVVFLLIQSFNGLHPTSGTGFMGDESTPGPCPHGTPVLQGVEDNTQTTDVVPASAALLRTMIRVRQDHGKMGEVVLIFKFNSVKIQP